MEKNYEFWEFFVYQARYVKRIFLYDISNWRKFYLEHFEIQYTIVEAFIKTKPHFSNFSNWKWRPSWILPKKIIPQHIFLDNRANIVRETLLYQNQQKSLRVPAISGFLMGFVKASTGLLLFSSSFYSL